ncbi:MAG TPA: oxygen-independent coproporphyrinogen III oxidase [Chitinophagaceae bacterium]|nr:oxygen-independent coproporphyrinogen III oxidase [Chitinophagaceae bacterium]
MTTKATFAKLVKKYNPPIPRYTSYPTVPVWKNGLDINLWQQLLQQQFSLHNTKNGISLYIHLPFCESLCTYCGCNKKITTNHSVEEEYLLMIEKEFSLYLDLLKEKPVIREIHLGGGTPTFFSPANLERLINYIKLKSIVHPLYEFSIEGHPNNTTREHLQSLYDLGFRRISYGVQDNDPEVQRIINRIQPLENVKNATEIAREIGFESVNFDLIYGLPKQSLQSITRTLEQVLKLRPERIAFYSYAHVPWTSRGQRLFDENDLPSPEEKLQLYLKGKEILINKGYTDIGMDHFALPTDTLYDAWKEGTLHRNFMGYTTQHTSILLGLGVSSISDTGTAFAQNKKSLHEYYESISNNEIPAFRGYFLNEEDIAFRKYILNISCQGKTKFVPAHLDLLNQFTFPELRELEKDQLIEWNESGLTVTILGRHFIRNICSAFDLHLIRNKKESTKSQFSKAI